MNFANNMEAMAYDKGGWKIVEESADGNIVYFGKPIIDNAELSDKVWIIKRVTTEVSDNGTTTTTTMYAPGRNSWAERESLTYTF